MKQLKIFLSGNWVLQHRNDDVLPIAVLKNELGSLAGVQIKETTLTTLTLVYDENIPEASDLSERTKLFFSDRYPQEQVSNGETILIIDVSDVADGDTDGKNDEDEDDDEEPISDLLIESKLSELEKRRREFVARLNGEINRAEAAERKSGPELVVNIKDRINNLVGAAEFKQLAQEIIDVADEIKRTKTHEVFVNRCYLFSIGDGYGLSTYLECLSELIGYTGLCNISDVYPREEHLGPYRENMEPFEEVMRVLNSIGSERSQRVLCVDISEWMNRMESKYFKQFIRAVEKHTNEFIVVFRVPFLEKDVLAKIQYSLADLLTIRTVTFPPLSHDEIQLCAENEFKRLGFSVARGAWRFFFERIAEEKSDGKFYGINSIKKVVREFIYQKHLINIYKAHKSCQITINDAKAVCSGADSSNLPAAEQLDKLIGIDSVKKRVEEIVAQIELALQDDSIDRPCIHMRFVGNPGTGKTTVARIIGQLLKEKGVLRVGAFFEYAGRDFCGRYIGETAPKTAGICRDAYGSVLFIDEAYSLYRSDDDSRDFGREAIDTLIAEMENHRNDLVVIMAGYNDDMDRLMRGNLGLASRMPYTIEFPNYTRDQLYEIFVSMVNAKFKTDAGLLDAAQKFFRDLPESVISAKEFSNARYVRNLFERTWAKAAMRCQLNGKKQVVLTKEDFEQAGADKEFIGSMPKKARIGFNT